MVPSSDMHPNAIDYWLGIAKAQEALCGRLDTAVRKYSSNAKDGYNGTVDIWQGHTGRKPHQYKRHWNVESVWKQSGCRLRKIVWTMMKDQKESFMDKDVLGGSPTSINGIGMSRVPSIRQRHWNVESTQYQMASDMSRIWNMLSMAFGCQEYTFGKDSGIRKTEKVLQEPDNGKWWFRGIKKHRIWMYKEVYARMITGYSHHRLHALA